MVIRLRSKRLALLFAEVWERLPEADQALLSERTGLILDNPSVLPMPYSPTWGAAMGIGVKKSIAIVYLSPRKLPRQPNDFVRYVIAHKLGHICCGHLDQLLFSTSEESQAFESEADERVSAWGFPIVAPTQTRKQPRKGDGYRKP